MRGRRLVTCGIVFIAGLTGCSRPKPDADPHEQLLTEQTAVLKEALPLFQSVTSKAAADAAAPKLTELHRRLVELRGQQKALGPSKSVKEKAYKGFVAAGARVTQEWLRLSSAPPIAEGGRRGVEGAEGIVTEWGDIMAALKEPLDNSK